MNPLNYLRLGVVLVVLAAISGGYWYIHHLQSELTASEAQVSTLTADLAVQNAAILKLKADGDARNNEANAAVHDAQAKVAPAKNQAQVIYKLTPPAANCVEALTLGNQK
jgi:hypothetical protein